MYTRFLKIRKSILLTIIPLTAILVLTMAAPTNAGLARTKFLGNIVAGSVPSNFATYWNQVTPENGGKWGSVEGTRGVMNWGQCDTAYNYARSNGFAFKFHCLVWGSQQPGWISGLSAADQKAEVTDWIRQAGARYSGAQLVDVVNEALHTTPPYANAIGGSGSTGWDWIVWSFQQARAAFPNSKLLINEYGIISDPNAASRYISIINILKSRGLVDGIGIQCHYFNMDNVSTSTMNSVLSSLAATGLPIYVSELDMTGDDATQLSRYQQKFPVLWGNSAVQGVTLWGYIEGQTWASGTHLITSSGAERPALQWLRTYLAGGPTSIPTPTRTPTSRPSPTPTPGRTPTPRTGTPTPTPGTPTPIPTWTATPRPGTPTPTPGSGTVKVQFFNGSKTDPSNQLYMNFQLVNTGSSAVTLSNVKMRYWYTEDGTQAQNFWCDYSPVGSGNITGTFVKMGSAKTGADTYLEVGFTSGAGSLNAGAGTQIQTRCAKSDWSNYTQSNDYSFNSSASSYADWNKVTGYVSGALAWGTEP